MNAKADTYAKTPGAFLKDLPAGSYVRMADLPGSRAAAKNAASRAAARGDLVRLRRDLYFKSTRTRYGTPTPAPMEVAREILRDTGVGPTGISAARALGLTTQLPVIPELVTSGHVPTGVSGVLIHKRNNVARCALNYIEIAVLEVLRNWRFLIEGGWQALVAAIRTRVNRTEIDLARIDAAARRERHRELSTAWSALLSDLGIDDLLALTA